MADIPVLLVEDSLNVQSALKELIDSIRPFRVAAIRDSEGRATEWLLDRKNQWRVAVVDLLLRDGAGFNVVSRLRSAYPQGHIVVFSEFATAALKQKCFALGADAVFLKSELAALIEHLQALGRDPLAARLR